MLIILKIIKSRLDALTATSTSHLPIMSGLASNAVRTTVNVARNIGKLSPLTTTFLLCDVQERFRDIIHNSETMINTSSFLTQTARVLEIPVVATEQYPKAFGHTVKQIDVSNVKLFEKKLFSMVTDEVNAHLSTLGRHNYVLYGIETHVCVQQTALDLLEKGCSVHIVVDGVSSCSALDRQIALGRMEKAGAYLTTAQSVVFALLGGAAHPNFKEVSKMIIEHGKKKNEFEEELLGKKSAL